MGSGRGNNPAPAQPARASVSGNFTNPRMRPAAQVKAPMIDPAGFNPSPSDKVVTGVTVLHLKFGEGKVTNVDGPKDNRVATIVFKDDELPERRIMLKFAKLQVM